MDSLQRTLLDSLARSSHYVAGGQARGLLRFVFQQDSVLVPEIISGTTKSSPGMFNGSIKKQKQVYLKVNPNPARDYISLEYQMPELNISGHVDIMDYTGRIVQRIQLNQKRGIKNISLENYQSGSYLCILTVDGKIYDKVKLVVIN